MNKYLAIYDQTGQLVSPLSSGTVREPVGVPFMWVEVPEGKELIRIDVSKSTHTPVFGDLPKAPAQALEILIAELKAEHKRQMEALAMDNLVAMEAVAELYEILQANGLMV